MIGPWGLMIQEAIRAAQLGEALEDFTQRAKLRRPVVGLAASDHINALRLLLENKVIEIEGKHLKLVEKLVPETLLTMDLEVAWSALELLVDDASRLRKFDAEALKAIGFEGEKYVYDRLCAFLPPMLRDQVIWTSLIDDSAGYDIETPDPDNPDKRLFLEIKTTTQQTEEFGFYLSRNEAQAGERLSGWRVICVRAKPEPHVAGLLSFENLKRDLPHDAGGCARWQSVSFRLPNIELPAPGSPWV